MQMRISLSIYLQIEMLRVLNRSLIDEYPKSAEDCVKWARELFDVLYRNEIAQLLHNFPENQAQSYNFVLTRSM